MSNTPKTPAARAADRFEVDGIRYAATADKLTATLPNKKRIVLSLVLDLEQLFNLVEGVESIDDEADVMQTMLALRQLLPADYLELTKDIDAALSLKVFMQWVQVLGQRLGKAIT